MLGRMATPDSITFTDTLGAVRYAPGVKEDRRNKAFFDGPELRRRLSELGLKARFRSTSRRFW